MAKSITAEMLEAREACDDQLAEFRRRFPDGVTFKSEKHAVELCLSVASVFGWDWAAENLLSAPALDAYLKAMAPALDAYEKTKAEALDAFEKAKAEALAAYMKAAATALDVYEKAEAEAFAIAFWRE